MLSNELICPHCSDKKIEEETILTVEALGGYVIHLFCTKCGMGFRISIQNGQYLLEKILAVDE